jgi:hypothetical protein
MASTLVIDSVTRLDPNAAAWTVLDIPASAISTPSATLSMSGPTSAPWRFSKSRSRPEGCLTDEPHC